MIDVGEVGGGDQAGDLGGDGRRREAGLLLPPLRAEGRAMGDDEVRGRFDVSRVEGRGGQPQGVGHQDRVGGLVELGPERVRRGLAVHQAVARHGTVGELLAVEEEQRGIPRRGRVSRGHQPGPGFVQIPREDLAVRTEVGVVGIAGRHRLTPRRGETGDDRAREGLVLGRLDDVRAQVVLAPELGDAAVGEAGQLRRRRLERPRRTPTIPPRSSSGPAAPSPPTTPRPRPPPWPGCLRTPARAPPCRLRVPGSAERPGPRCRPWPSRRSP